MGRPKLGELGRNVFVSLRFTPDEYAVVKSVVDGNLSVWMRKLVLAEADRLLAEKPKKQAKPKSK